MAQRSSERTGGDGRNPGHPVRDTPSTRQIDEYSLVLHKSAEAWAYLTQLQGREAIGPASVTRVIIPPSLAA